MSDIIIYNRNKESHQNHPNNYPIYRPSILGNPYTHIKDKKTKAIYLSSSREEAIEQYAHYFDVMYSGNTEYQQIIDDIYEKYKNGEDIYLECYCAPLPCHGDIIKDKLRRRLIKEAIKKRG